MNTSQSLCVIGALLLSLTAQAATITVTSTSDSGAGTLRNALASATDGDTINFSVTGTILLTTGPLYVGKSLTIVGPGPANLAVDGGGADLVFVNFDVSGATISGLTITNGNPGIHNERGSTLTVSNCVFTGNSGVLGGAIFNQGFDDVATLTVIACTFTGNSAHFGGAICNEGTHFGGSAVLSVSNCTFTGNSTTGNTTNSYGGAIFNNVRDDANATLTVHASTFNGNVAHVGGGIWNNGTASVSASTFSGNSAPGVFQAQSIYNGGGGSVATVAIGDTILKADNILNLVGGGFTSLGYNLSSDDGGGVLTATGDQINTDPLLGPLQDNGGPTFTHALLPGSPAIDKGKRNAITNLVSTLDQRGLPRLVDDPCIANADGGDGSDIGAFETQAICVTAINSITVEESDIRISWTTYPGKTNVIERTSGLAGTNNFTSITNIITTGTTTNYLDVGATTNAPALYYRVRLVP